MRNKVEDCKYNVGVGCGERLGCESCGWNPEVIAKRKNGLRRGWVKRIPDHKGRRVTLNDVLGLLREEERVFVVHRMGLSEGEGVAEGTVRELRSVCCVEACGDSAVEGIALDLEQLSDEDAPVLVITI